MAAWRAPGPASSMRRQSSPATKPTMAPCEASSGELSNVRSMTERGATIWPFRPSSRQNGAS